MPATGEITFEPGEISRRLLVLRGQRVLRDADPARICGVPTGRLNEQAKRNARRFPEDFVFQLTRNERVASMLHSATLNTEAPHGKGKQPCHDLPRSSTFALANPSMAAKELVKMPNHHRAATPGSHSADVRMHLLIERTRLGVAQLGPDFAILATRVNLPATTAELVVQIDGHEKRRTVYLPDGVQASVNRTTLHPDLPSPNCDLRFSPSP